MMRALLRLVAGQRVRPLLVVERMLQVVLRVGPAVLDRVHLGDAQIVRSLALVTFSPESISGASQVRSGKR